MVTVLPLLWAALGCTSPTEAPPAGGGTPSEQAIRGASTWMVDWLAEQRPRFDAIVGAAEAASCSEEPALKRVIEAARPHLASDSNHAMWRFVDPAFPDPGPKLQGWTAEAGSPRVNVDYVVIEALYCRSRPWRAQTTAYACGPMRDRGGYHTTHALWALATLVHRGCPLDDELVRCRDALIAELVEAQPAALRPSETLDIDLYAERLLTVELAGGSPETDAWAAALLEAQRPDGSWQVPAEEHAYFAFHATLASAWALAAWSAPGGRPGCGQPLR